LGELKPEDADVLRQCDMAGTTQRAYAELQGLSLPAVKSRLLRARQRLRERMAKVCRVHFDPQDGRVCGHEGRARPAGPGPA
jgi:RNA polymerase sigma-70 factor (ECF subfamily)